MLMRRNHGAAHAALCKHTPRGEKADDNITSFPCSLVVSFTYAVLSLVQSAHADASATKHGTMKESGIIKGTNRVHITPRVPEQTSVFIRSLTDLSLSGTCVVSHETLTQITRAEHEWAWKGN